MNKDKYLALIALGGNLGDVQESFSYTILQLETVGQIKAKSPTYRTNPVGGPKNQLDYLNAVVALKTSLDAEELLAFLLNIEKERGRVRHEKWGPRTLDLDILDYGNQLVNKPHLTLPHPRMWERGFVLVPLSDIVPSYIHPKTDESLEERLKTIDQSGVTRLDD